MIKSVVREFKWNPQIIDNLYIDDRDHYGLDYWYKDLKKVHKELKNK